MDQNDIERFVEAQNKPPLLAHSYQIALTEMHAGRKQKHWIWYVFPQKRSTRAGLSEYSKRYGISDDAEALRYLHHPILGPRLAEITQVVHTQLIGNTTSPEYLMNGKTDVRKLRSCMNLFRHVGKHADAQSLPWLTTFLAHADAIFHLIDKPEYRHR